MSYMFENVDICVIAAMDAVIVTWLEQRRVVMLSKQSTSTFDTAVMSATNLATMANKSIGIDDCRCVSCAEVKERM